MWPNLRPREIEKCGLPLCAGRQQVVVNSELSLAQMICTRSGVGCYGMLRIFYNLILSIAYKLLLFILLTFIIIFPRQNLPEKFVFLYLPKKKKVSFR